jgi:hypothetical protein
MNVDTAALRHFGVDGKPLDEVHLREFMKIHLHNLNFLDLG